MLEMVSLVGIWQVFRMGTNTEESLKKKKSKEKKNNSEMCLKMSQSFTFKHLELQRQCCSLL